MSGISFSIKSTSCDWCDWYFVRLSSITIVYRENPNQSSGWWAGTIIRLRLWTFFVWKLHERRKQNFYLWEDIDTVVAQMVSVAGGWLKFAFMKS